MAALPSPCGCRWGLDRDEAACWARMGARRHRQGLPRRRRRRQRPPAPPQGGPGCSSLFGALYELGPQLVDGRLGLQPNPGAGLSDVVQLAGRWPQRGRGGRRRWKQPLLLSSAPPLHRLLEPALSAALHRPACRHRLQRGRRGSASPRSRPLLLPGRMRMQRCWGPAPASRAQPAPCVCAAGGKRGVPRDEMTLAADLYCALQVAASCSLSALAIQSP